MGQVLVTGGTGQLGRALSPILAERGHRVRITSRSAAPTGTPSRDWTQVDWVTGAGLLTALDGVDTVVHCASGSPKGERTTIDSLLTAVGRTRPHLIYISIVGIDRIPMGYYRAKLEVEQAITDSGVPHSILRATQFHSLIAALLGGLAKAPVVLLPKDLQFQPIAVTAVAARLAELADGAPAGRVDDIGGPQVRTLPDLAQAYLTSRGRHRPVIEVPIPGKLMKALRDGANTTPGHVTPGQTFEEYLGRTGTLDG